MILQFILGALAVAGFLSTLWQWLVARRFPLHQRGTAKSTPAPAVTLLKPIKGADEFTEPCLRSWMTQQYNGEVQILFGVTSVEDRACEVVERLLAEFPACDARLVICPERLGANAKVSKLAHLETLAKHDVLVVSDADVQVTSDLLANLTTPLSRPDVGLVNCFYRFANPTTPAMHWEAIAVNADFWSQVLQGACFRKLDFALGAVMATHRSCLRELGGFRELADCLADDYQLGHRIARRGHKIELCPVVVECWSSPQSWREVWRHQLRWARTIRVCQPLPYFFSIVSNGTLWTLLWAAAGSSSVVTFCAAGFLLARLLVADSLQRRLTPTHRRFAHLWLVPVKDLLQAALWVGAFTGNHIEWRGERYHLRRDGTLARR